MVSFFHWPVSVTFRVKLQIDNNYCHLSNLHTLVAKVTVLAVNFILYMR